MTRLPSSALAWLFGALLLGACSSNPAPAPAAPTPVTPAPVTPTPVADTVAPTLSLGSVPESTEATSLSVSAQASDNVAVREVRFYLNGTLVQRDAEAPYEARLELGANGEYTLRAEAEDTSGNVTKASRVIRVNRDQTPPSLSLELPASPVTQPGNYSVVVSASDDRALSRVEGTLVIGKAGGQTVTEPINEAIPGGGQTYRQVFPLPVTAELNGTYTFRLTAYDLAGNPSATLTRTVTVAIPAPAAPTPTPTPPPAPTPTDTTAPTVAIAQPQPVTVSQATSVPVAVSAADDVGVVSLVGTLEYASGEVRPLGPLNPAGGVISVPVSPELGNVRMTLVARDAAGNEGRSSVLLQVTAARAPAPTPTPTPAPADTVAPTVSVSAPQRVTQPGLYVVSVQAGDNMGVTSLVARVTLPSGQVIGQPLPVAGGAFEVPVSAAQNGTLVITAVARDAAGNEGRASTTVTVAIP